MTRPYWRVRPVLVRNEPPAPVPLPVPRAELPLAEGYAALEVPFKLSASSHRKLKEWLELMVRLAEPEPEPAPDQQRNFLNDAGTTPAPGPSGEDARSCAADPQAA